MNDLFLLTAVLSLLLLLWLWIQRRRQQSLLQTVPVVTLPAVRATRLNNERDVFVYLPPNYAHEDLRYPVIYLNDGQDREALQLRQTLAELYAAPKIQPLIVVAIPATDDRLQEYGTAVAPNAQKLGTKAAAYAHFVTDELMPVVNAHFRTRTDPRETAVAGLSLGGLSAFDLAWNHPHLFGNVGVMSGSFWWRAGAAETAVAPNRRIAHEMVRRSHYRPGFRAWFQAATLDELSDRDSNGVIDAIQDTQELIDELEALGYRRGTEITYVEVSGGRHNHHTWARVLPQFLKWAFPT